MDRFPGRSPRIGAALVVLGVMFVTTGFSLAAFAAPGNGNGNGNGDGRHIEICHFSGRPGSGEYQTLTVSANSNGHFDNNGTHRAGHEADYLGPCVEDEVEDTTPTTVEDTTPTTVEDTTPTTVEDTTPTTVEDITPTTVEDATPTTVEEDTESLGETNDTTTTTTTDVDDSEIVSVGGEETTTTTSLLAAESDAAGVEVETLPYTGPNTYLVVPGVIMLLVGAFAVFLSYGFGRSGRSHMATDQARISLGLHRGRHQG